ncbi:MAG: hypothetical protein ACLRNW_22155 [Neglectibacter sp.]
MFTTNLEHQGTLWHATPFGTVFLSRILEKALMESGQNPRLASLPEVFAGLLCLHPPVLPRWRWMEHASPSPASLIC